MFDRYFSLIYDLEFGPQRIATAVEFKRKHIVDSKNLRIDGKPVEVYINNRTTVLRVGDERFIATAEPGELFDIEKGILVCLAKYFGINSSFLLKLADGVKVQTPKEKKPAKKKK